MGAEADHRAEWHALRLCGGRGRNVIAVAEKPPETVNRS